MRLIKIFKGNEEQTDELQQEVNNWITSTGAKLLDITGNIAPQSPMSHPNARPMPSDVLLIATYQPAGVTNEPKVKGNSNTKEYYNQLEQESLSLS